MKCACEILMLRLKLRITSRNSLHVGYNRENNSWERSVISFDVKRHALCDEYSAINNARTYCNNFRYEVESDFLSGYFRHCKYSSKSNHLQSITTLRTNE